MRHLLAQWRELVITGNQRSNDQMSRQTSGGAIYRGFKVYLPVSLRGQIDSLLAPPMETSEIGRSTGIGKLVVEWLVANHPNYDDYGGPKTLGRHWTTRYEMARTAAYQGGAGDVGIILTATFNPADEDPDHTFAENAHMRESESEITLMPGAQVVIHNVELINYYGADSAELIDQPIRSQAMPSWRAISYDEPWWTNYDAVIATDVNGRGRNYEVFTYGQQVATRHSLDEAKAYLEEMYGPLPWRREAMPKEVAIHYWFGVTDEFSDPTTALVVDRLPALGVQSSVRGGGAISTVALRSNSADRIGPRKRWLCPGCSDKLDLKPVVLENGTLVDDPHVSLETCSECDKLTFCRRWTVGFDRGDQS